MTDENVPSARRATEIAPAIPASLTFYYDKGSAYNETDSQNEQNGRIFGKKIFRALNADSFNGELEEPVITIQDTPTAYGHVTVGKAWSVKDERQRELNIAAGTLQRPIEEVAATMLHEMVHLYNLQHEIQDCSRGGTYHNKKFRDEAQKHMLTIERHEKYGWTVTKPTEELIDYIINKGWEDIMMNRASFPFSISGGRKGKSTGEDGTGNHEAKEQQQEICMSEVQNDHQSNTSGQCGMRGLRYPV